MSAFDPKRTWASQNCCCARSPVAPISQIAVSCFSWKHVVDRLYVAARDDVVNDAVVALRLVLQLEQVPCLPQ
jgi:hypothetical protein